jgi:hypothetical protein
MCFKGFNEFKRKEKPTFKASHLALFFSKRLYELLKENSPSYLVQSNLRLVEILLSLGLTFLTAKFDILEPELKMTSKPIKLVTKTIKSILCDFSIKQATVLKLLFRFVLNHSPDNGFETALESLKFCLNDEEEEFSMQLKANPSCVSTALVTILVHLEAYLALKKKEKEGFSRFFPLLIV